MNTSITGLILAGGRATRMGGVDKGLQILAGKPLAAHALARLRPQVEQVLINANRNTDAYAALGAPVVADADASFPGPLAGLLAGLHATRTEWLLAVPCDAPALPSDLASRLMAAGADAAFPLTPDGLAQPVFCLLRRHLAAELAGYLDGGGRKVEAWLRSLPSHAAVPFPDAAAFRNINTLDELRSHA